MIDIGVLGLMTSASCQAFNLSPGFVLLGNFEAELRNPDKRLVIAVHGSWQYNYNYSVLQHTSQE
jgi:hypothetical protein